MAKLFSRTFNLIGRPAACIVAAAAGCLVTPNLDGGKLIAQQTNQNSALDTLLLGDHVEITPIPPVESQAVKNGFVPLSPLRSGHLESPAMLQAKSGLQPKQTMGAAAGQAASAFGTTNQTVQNVLGSPQPSSSLNTQSTARMLVPEPVTVQSNPISTAVWQSPSTPASDNQAGFIATQASFVQSDENGQSVLVPEARYAALEPQPTFAQPNSGTHKLRHVNVSQFESELVTTWGNRLQASSSTDGRFVRVDMPNKSGKRLAMLVDRQTSLISFEGDASLQDNWHQMISGLDYQPIRRADGGFEHLALVNTGKTDPAKIQQVAFLMGLDQANAGQDSVTLPPNSPRPRQDEILPGGQGAAQGLKNKVKIVEDPDTGLITLVGDKEDLDIVRKIILELAAESEAAKPDVARIPLNNIQSQAFATQIQEMYDASYSPSTGPAQINPIPSPNSLIVVGQPQAIEAVRKIVTEMDVESADKLDGFKSFRLKNISATDAKNRLDLFFGQLAGGQGNNTLPSAPVVTIADYRSNTVTVKGSRQFITEAERYLKEIDIADSDATSIVKIIPVKNALAEDIAIVIQDAINGQQPNSGQGYNPNQQAQQQQQNQGQNIAPEESHIRSQALSLKTIGEDGKVVSSGILFDVRITADRNSNSLVVTAPAESMALVEALIKQLDKVPDAETLIKVFHVSNGDAQELLTMLQSLFTASQTQAGGGAGGLGGTTNNLSQLPLQKASATEGSSLINLRFAVDARTNSIIASGPAGDLQVVEDLLNRLDSQAYNDYIVKVFRLSNAPVLDVEEAINAWLDARATILTNDPRAVGGLNQAIRQVIVTSEVVSNSLIIQARPEYLSQIMEIVEALDRRPPMVKVKILLAEVDLNQLEEFGVELGVQDSLVFDRGTSVAADDSITGIGFPFNRSPLQTANRNATFRETLAGQAVNNLALGLTNPNLGYGGLVLSASNESINILIRALKDKNALRVLSKPHIMTLENLQGRFISGAQVPRVAGTTQSNFGVTQNVEFVDVGVIIEITPRVSQDGMIVMTVDAKRSEVGPDSTAITIGFSTDGSPILSPQILEIEANTTLMARSGQTVVFSGLIQETKEHRERGVPVLSDIPGVGSLFKYESDIVGRKELLIIMTPYLVTDDESLDLQNDDEMGRMHWCLSDVAEVYGNTNYDTFNGEESAVETFYPDADPAGLQPQIYQENGSATTVPGQMRPGSR